MSERKRTKQGISRQAVEQMRLMVEGKISRVYDPTEPAKDDRARFKTAEFHLDRPAPPPTGSGSERE